LGRLRKKLCFYVQKQKNKNKMLDWLFIIIAAILYVGSNNVNAGVHPAVPLGLLVASLAFFVAGMFKLFTNGEEEDDDDVTNPGRARSAKFNAFKMTAEDDESAWCIGTYYAIAYKVGDVTSEVGPLTDEIKSSTHTQPMFTIDYTPPSGTVRWYRAVEGVNGGQLRPHEMDTGEVNGVTYFIDTDNPCKEPYRPEPPQAPIVGGGQFGDSNQWEIQAGPGAVPWCKNTLYYATYAKAGTNANESELSEPSIPFTSKEFSNPCLSVAAPRTGYEVNWYRQKLDSELFITLPLFDVAGELRPQGLIMFAFEASPNIPMTILPAAQNPLLSFEDLWEIGSPTLTIPVALFIQRWNEALPPPIQGYQHRGALSALADGRLVMNGLAIPGEPRPVIVIGPSIPWWTAMGFSSSGISSIENVIAQTVPISNLNTRTDELELIGTGPQLIDRENPCLLPNGPTAEPRWVDWRKEF
jgi:hypothetical protein